MSTLMTQQRMTEQEKADYARELIDALVFYFVKIDSGKTRTRYRSTVVKLKKLRNHTDMHLSLNGYCSLKKQNRGYIRGAIHGASIVLVTVLITAYFLAAFNAWGWM